MEKQKTHIFEIIVLGLILIAALLLRLWNLDKPQGMWFDEMNTYFDAKMRFSQMFEVFFTRHIHTPLYYIFLSLWMKIFGESDFTIRLLSVVFGVLTVPVMYLCGKELKCDKTALLAGFFAAINSLLIYYSQEVRIYSLTSMFSALAVLFLLRLNNNPSKGNVVGLIIANTGLLYTHSLSFVFVFFEFAVFGLYYLLKKREMLKPLIIAGFVTFILYSPYLYRLFVLIKGTDNTGITAQWWSKFTYSKILFVLGDFFSPWFIAINNPPDNYCEYMFQNMQFTLIAIFFVIVPLLMGLYGIINGVLKNKPVNLLLLLICVGYMSTIASKSAQGSIVYISRYLIEIAPIFLLLCAYGLINSGNKLLSKVLITLFIVLNLFFMTFSGSSAVNKGRSAGFKPIANILDKYYFSDSNTFIFVGYPGEFFLKYLSSDSSFSQSSSNPQRYFIGTWNFEYLPYYLSGDITLDEISKLGYITFPQIMYNTSQEILNKRDELRKENISSAIYADFRRHKKRERYNYEYYKGIIESKENIFVGSGLKKQLLTTPGQYNRLLIVVPTSLVNLKGQSVVVDMFKNAPKIEVRSYKQVPITPILYLRTTHDLIEYVSQELELEKKESAGLWDVYVFKGK